LGGVYKLSAIRGTDGAWEHKIKLSEQAVKVTNPGVLQVRRFRMENEFVGDGIYDETRPLPERFAIVDPADATRRKHFGPEVAHEDLLVPILRRGDLVYEFPTLDATRTRVQQQLAMLHPGIKRFDNPHEYPAGLELTLHEFKTKMILQAKGEA
jgi:nicotinate phosphoribosyltransferase